MYAFSKCMKIQYKYSSNTIYSVFCPADSTDLGIAMEVDRKDADAEYLETYSKEYDYT